MFEYVSLNKQIINERKKNARLQAQLEKAVGNIDYISMMADIDLDLDETEEIFDEQ